MIAELALLVALTTDPAPDESPYVLVVWESTGTYPELWPQKLVTYLDVASPDLHALDGSLPTCGVIQVDRYWDNATTRDLIAGGVLLGPGNPPESLAYVGSGDPWRVIDLGECVPVVPPVDPPVVVVPPVEPPIVPPADVPSVTPDVLASTGGPDWGVLAVFGPILICIGLLGRRYWGNPESKR